MDKENKAKIVIRGKGSLKDGKGRPGNPADDTDKDLRSLFTGDDPVRVKACIDLINSLIAIVSLSLPHFSSPLRIGTSFGS
jgi:splicing factor 1